MSRSNQVQLEYLGGVQCSKISKS